MIENENYDDLVLTTQIPLPQWDHLIDMTFKIT
jgi:hypothetical protein